mmetsp:Transcript_21936/g.74572  ORF Transcript_21936/g.74572 Transcript_21936/m.74572 type:complete len:85 (+) Transcript_21936:612-866(+)
MSPPESHGCLEWNRWHLVLWLSARACRPGAWHIDLDKMPKGVLVVRKVEEVGLPYALGERSPLEGSPIPASCAPNLSGASSQVS